MLLYKYGMRLRGFSIGCQPLGCFVRMEEDKTNKYYDLLYYTRPLTERECKYFDLDFLGMEYDHKNDN